MRNFLIIISLLLNIACINAQSYKLNATTDELDLTLDGSVVSGKQDLTDTNTYDATKQWTKNWVNNKK